MKIEFTKKALEDFEFWKNSGHKAILKKISLLLKDIKKSPFSRIGKPEKLKHHLSGCLSRRINSEHRLVYEVQNEKKCITVLAMRFHY